MSVVRPVSSDAYRYYSPAVGAHGPIQMRVEPVSAQNLRTYYHLETETPGLDVEYRGHRDDLAAAGCLRGTRDILRQWLFGDEPSATGDLLPFNRFHPDSHGGVIWMSSKAGPGRRGWIAVDYCCCSRPFAAALPWVREYAADILLQMEGHPKLRLVVDNTLVTP